MSHIYLTSNSCSVSRAITHLSCVHMRIRVVVVAEWVRHWDPPGVPLQVMHYEGQNYIT